MKLECTSFENGGEIPSKYTCEGENISPCLKISGAPKDTKSFALTLFDPDIPQEFKDKMNIPGWDHWQVWNIKPDTTIIEENSIPIGVVEGKQTGGDLGYTGPCPPKDKEPPKHRYVFTIYALDAESLDLPEGSTRVELEKAMEGNVLEKAELTGTYEKKE